MAVKTWKTQRIEQTARILMTRSNSAVRNEVSDVRIDCIPFEVRGFDAGPLIVSVDIGLEGGTGDIIGTRLYVTNEREDEWAIIDDENDPIQWAIAIAVARYMESDKGTQHMADVIAAEAAA